MSLIDFKKRFGKSVTLEEVKTVFVNEINHLIFERKVLRDDLGYYYSDRRTGMFDIICLQLGLNPSDVVNGTNRNRYALSSDLPQIPGIRFLTKDDFEMTLVLIEIIYDYYSARGFASWSEGSKDIHAIVTSCLSRASLPLGMRWKDGKFYPEGAEELDAALIDDLKHWLHAYPKVSELYKNALGHYSQSFHDPVKRKDVISNAQQAVDAITRVLLGDEKAFDNSLKDLPVALGLGQEWKGLLNQYNEISKQFGRHPGRGEIYIPEQSETEAYLYLTGIIIRLIVHKIKSR